MYKDLKLCCRKSSTFAAISGRGNIKLKAPILSTFSARDKRSRITKNILTGRKQKNSTN